MWSPATRREHSRAGLRYATAIGPIRVDIGVPLNRQRGDSAYALYVGIGQAF
ncbi:MAG: BamA/TamA family outer membrane protein [Elioraea tepidiphila]